MNLFATNVSRWDTFRVSALILWSATIVVKRDTREASARRLNLRSNIVCYGMNNEPVFNDRLDLELGPYVYCGRNRNREVKSD